MLLSSFNGDETNDSYWIAQRHLSGRNILEDTLWWTSSFMNSFGKINPISHLTSIISYTIGQDRVVFKLLQFILQLIVCFVASLLPLILLDSLFSSILYVSVASSVTFFSGYFDAYTMFGSHMKIATITSLTTIILSIIISRYNNLSKYLVVQNKSVYSALFFGLLIVDSFTYETFAVTSLIVISVYYCFRKINPHAKFHLYWSILLFAAYVSSRVYYKINSVADFANYKVSSNIAGTTELYAKQVLSTFPFSAIIQQQPLSEVFVNELPSLVALIIVAVTGYIFYLRYLSKCGSKFEKPKRKMCLLLMFIGLVMILVTPILIASSSGLQAVIRIGDGYILNYYQTIGLALVITSLASFIELGGRFQKLIFLIITALLTASAYTFNSYLVFFNRNGHADIKLNGYIREQDEAFIRKFGNTFSDVQPMPPRQWLNYYNIKRLTNYGDSKLFKASFLMERFDARPQILPTDCRTESGSDKFICILDRPASFYLSNAVSYTSGTSIVSISNKIVYSDAVEDPYNRLKNRWYPSKSDFDVDIISDEFYSFIRRDNLDNFTAYTITKDLARLKIENINVYDNGLYRFRFKTPVKASDVMKAIR
jgi:hypothetical protein